MLDFLKRNKKNESTKKIEGPLVSIVIPLYNHEKFIGQAIEGILNQTYQTWELIIIDDGSKDNSVKVAKKYKDARITLIEQENAGAHNAINRGLKMAKGEYLAILNSDDVYEKNRFEIMIAEMEKNPEIGFMCSYITVINDEGKKLGVKEGWKNMESWQVPHPELSFKQSNDFKKNLLMTNFTSTTSNFLIRRSLYEKIGGMRNLRFAHDWDFALRAAEVTECKMIEKPLMQYRVHNSNTISSNRKWMLFEIAWMWATNIKRFYGTLLFVGKGSQEDIISLVESINLQGNDKIFWIILMFIEAQEKIGVTNPEEILLDNDELRNRLLEYVVE
ncbi:MAG TPA: cell wall biosynthesis glycosyltransferase [Roseburia sp.]|nr:cell wall biosynthesis glycosyltransferase [Roseburia sp.]